MTPSREAIEAAARAIRRQKFERTHILKAYDPTIDPTENELDEAEAALTAAYARDFPQPSKSDEERAVEKAYVTAATKAGEDGWRAEANAKGFVAALTVYDEWRDKMYKIDAALPPKP